VALAAERRTLQGYNLVGWSADGIGYWAVSDLGAGDLDKFVRLFREAPPDR
jgi:anti-sigma factor RsiW